MKFFEPDSLSDTVGVYAWVLERVGPLTVGIGMMAWTGWMVASKALNMGVWFGLSLSGIACLGAAISALRLKEASVKAPQEPGEDGTSSSRGRWRRRRSSRWGSPHSPADSVPLP